MIEPNQTNNTAQAIWLSIGTLSGLLVGIGSAVVLSRVFDKAEYGSYRQIIFVYQSFLVVFSAGLPKVFSYFLPRHPIEQGRAIINRINSILLVSGLIFSILMFYGAEFLAETLRNHRLIRGFKLFSLVPVLLLPTVGIQSIMSTYRITKFAAIYNVISRLSQLSLILFFVFFFNESFESALLGWIGGGVIALILAMYFKRLPFKEVERHKANLRIGEIFKYSLPILGASISGIAIKSSDQFYLSRYFGTEVYAEYANGFIQLPFVAVITASISSILMPVFSRLNHEESEKNVLELKRLLLSSLEKSVMILYPLVLFFIYEAKDVVTLLFGELYEMSTPYFRLALIINLFNVIMSAPLLLSLGKSKTYFLIHLFGALTVWLGGWFFVSFFHNPVFLVSWSVFVNITIILSGFVIISRVIGLSIFALIPLRLISTLILSGILSLLIINVIPFSITILPLKLLVEALIFSFLMMLFSFFLGTDYYKFIRSFSNLNKLT